MCVEEANYQLLNLSRNHGHQIAITAGIDLAKGDAVAVIDGDLQDPPETIVDLYGKMQEGFDVVYAVRKNARVKLLSSYLLQNCFIVC